MIKPAERVCPHHTPTTPLPIPQNIHCQGNKVTTDKVFLVIKKKHHDSFASAETPQCLTQGGTMSTFMDKLPKHVYSHRQNKDHLIPANNQPHNLIAPYLIRLELQSISEPREGTGLDTKAS